VREGGEKKKQMGGGTNEVRKDRQRERRWEQKAESIWTFPLNRKNKQKL
jgi:hypothetical protein